MLEEMDKLSDEIREKNDEGEVILFMDGNGKIGLLGEELSRNGKLLQDVFGECELEVMNRSGKCKGSITRVNRKNPDERSAIDFLVVSEEAEQAVEKVEIDEEGDFLLKGSAASDHNSFLVDLRLQNADIGRKDKLVRWRLNAPAEKWIQFKDELTLKSR